VARWWLVGAGSFQLYDGLVQHKLLGLHQIRYGVDLTVYDLLGNVSAGVLLVARPGSHSRWAPEGPVTSLDRE
jgi:uncharacterized membrane protein